MTNPSVPFDLDEFPGLELALQFLAKRRRIDDSLAEGVMLEVMTGDAPPEAVKQWLLGLRARGESADDIAGAARALRDKMIRVRCEDPSRLVDTCGTGGGKLTTINISTAAALIVAAAGVPVAKHGNRSFTSRSGSADVLESLGVDIEHSPEGAARALARNGMVFLYAPLFHPGMRHLVGLRRELKVGTLMNLIGPLANPAGVQRQLVGVAERARGLPMATALRDLETEHALVVYGHAGLDEISPVGPTSVWEVRGGEISEWTFEPAAVGMFVDSLDELQGGSPNENAARILRFLERRQPRGALRSAILVNAAAGLYLGGRAISISQGIALSAEILESGEPLRQLERLQYPLTLMPDDGDPGAQYFRITPTTTP